MNAPLRAKEYFDTRATAEMREHLRPVQRTIQESLAYTCRILAATGQEAGLAGQISARSEHPGAYWTLRFGLGFDERSEEHTSELQSLMRISYAVFCLKKK